MGVAATHRVAASVSGVRSRFTCPMDMVAVGLDILIYIRMNRLPCGFAVKSCLKWPDREMLPALAFETGALNHVPKVRDDAHLCPELAILIKVDPPGIAAAFRKD